jgi:hypothetical protein
MVNEVIVAPPGAKVAVGPAIIPVAMAVDARHEARRVATAIE